MQYYGLYPHCTRINGYSIRTSELLDHLVVVLKSSFQYHLRIIHLPSPLSANWVCVVSRIDERQSENLRERERDGRWEEMGKGGRG